MTVIGIYRSFSVKGNPAISLQGGLDFYFTYLEIQNFHVILRHGRNDNYTMFRT
jgi:hypothetical protein